MKKITVPLYWLDDFKNDFPAPGYATAGSAGMDLCAAIKDPIVVKPLRRAIVPTGFSMALPVGYEAQIRARSGLVLKHGITVPNAPGTVDSDYRDEIKVILYNIGDSEFYIERGMRIAQMVVSEISQVSFEESDKLEKTDRHGGFGSTGL